MLSLKASILAYAILVDLLLFFFALTTLITAFKVIKCDDPKLKKLAKITAIFATGNIISQVAYFFVKTNYVFFFFTLCEAILLLVVFQLTLRGLPQKIINALLLLCFPLSVLLILMNNNDTHRDIYFAYVTLTATSGSYFYFRQLKNKITFENLFLDPEIYFIIGVFFCNSIYLLPNIAFLSFDITHPDFIKTTKSSAGNSFFIIALMISASLGKLCYLFLYFFINKGLKCKTYNTPGISL